MRSNILVVFDCLGFIDNACQYIGRLSGRPPLSLIYDERVL
jgi:hypothetical protein